MQGVGVPQFWKKTQQPQSFSAVQATSYHSYYLPTIGYGKAEAFCILRALVKKKFHEAYKKAQW